jgi:hypothetical protein
LDDLSKERIRFNIEIIKLLTLLITTGGGGLALMVKSAHSLPELILGVCGMFVAAACGILAIFLYKNTLRKLRENGIK